MDVQVKNGLAGTRPDVADGTQRFPDLALPRDLSCDQITVADEIGIRWQRFR